MEREPGQEDSLAPQWTNTKVATHHLTSQAGWNRCNLSISHSYSLSCSRTTRAASWAESEAIGDSRDLGTLGLKRGN